SCSSPIRAPARRVRNGQREVSMSQELISKVQSLYAAFGRGDVDAIFDALSEDVSWGVDSTAAVDVPWYGVLNGKANAKKFFAALGEEAEFSAFTPKDF